MFAETIIGKADDDENDGKEGKAHKLDGLAANGIYRRYSDPVARYGASTDEDEIANGGVIENLVHVGSLGITNGLQDDRVVQSKPIAIVELAKNQRVTRSH